MCDIQSMNFASTALSVALIGASDNPARYAYMAMLMLEDYGHTVHLISPRLTSIAGRPVYSDISILAAKNTPIHTVTLYVGPTISTRLAQGLIELSPHRVIFNPGAENTALQQQLAENGIAVLEACTLVMLRTGAF